MSVQSVLCRFRGLKPVPEKPNFWKACCFIHKNGGERRPSVVLWLNGKGHLMGKCFACGARVPAQLQAAGIPMSELRDDDGRRARSSAEEEAWDNRKIVAEYVYTDEQGQPLYRVCRWHPKAFHQERWEGGKWWPGLAKTRRVLYRLPELIAKREQPVLVVEGEKDVELLRSHGLLATCNVGGTGMGWHEDYSKCLYDRRVAVVADLDGPGMRHAEAVVGSLFRAGAHSVRLVHAYGVVPEIKDVSDFFFYWERMQQTDPKKMSVKDQFLGYVRSASEWVNPIRLAEKQAAERRAS